MTDDDIKRAREIIAAATPGPWPFMQTALGFHLSGLTHGPADGQFISAARTGWPEALDEVGRLQASENSLLESNGGWSRRSLKDAEKVVKLRSKIDSLRAENERLKEDVEDYADLAKSAQEERNQLRAVAEAAGYYLCCNGICDSDCKGKLTAALKAWRGDK